MNARAHDQYLRGAVLTATPEQLQLMLFDGAIRFVTQARDAIQAKDIEQTHNLLTRAQRIVVEMQNSLRPEIDQALCGQVASLYNFVYRRLVDGNVQRDVQALDEALGILRHLRETWVLLMDTLQQERAAPPGRAPAPPPPDGVPAAAGGFSAEG